MAVLPEEDTGTGEYDRGESSERKQYNNIILNPFGTSEDHATDSAGTEKPKEAATDGSLASRVHCRRTPTRTGGDCPAMLSTLLRPTHQKVAASDQQRRDPDS